MTVNQQTISNLSKVGSLGCEARCLPDEGVAGLSETKVDEMDQWELEDTLGQLEICEGVLDTINGKGLIEVEEEEEV